MEKLNLELLATKAKLLPRNISDGPKVSGSTTDRKEKCKRFTFNRRGSIGYKDVCNTPTCKRCFKGFNIHSPCSPDPLKISPRTTRILRKQPLSDSSVASNISPVQTSPTKNEETNDLKLSDSPNQIDNGTVEVLRTSKDLLITREYSPRIDGHNLSSDSIKRSIRCLESLQRTDSIASPILKIPKVFFIPPLVLSDSKNTNEKSVNKYFSKLKNNTVDKIKVELDLLNLEIITEVNKYLTQTFYAGTEELDSLVLELKEYINQDTVFKKFTKEWLDLLEKKFLNSYKNSKYCKVILNKLLR